MRENLRGLPIDSRYSPTTEVFASSIQYCMRSLPDTSARLPEFAKTDRPNPRRAAEARMATPRAPLWLNRPSGPGAGTAAEREAFSRTVGSLLMTPNEDGPTTRIPHLRARRRSLSWSSSPSGPASAKPALATSRVWTPALPHSLAIWTAWGAGTATMARSTCPGISAILA